MYRAGTKKFSNGADSAAVVAGLTPMTELTAAHQCSSRQAFGDLVKNVEGGGMCAGAHHTAGTCPGHSGQNSCCGRGDGSMTERRIDTYSTVKAELYGCLQNMWDEGELGHSIWPDTGHYDTMASAELTHASCGFAWTAGGRVMMNQDFTQNVPNEFKNAECHCNGKAAGASDGCASRFGAGTCVEGTGGPSGGPLPSPAPPPPSPSPGACPGESYFWRFPEETSDKSDACTEADGGECWDEATEECLAAGSGNGDGACPGESYFWRFPAETSDKSDACTEADGGECWDEATEECLAAGSGNGDTGQVTITQAGNGRKWTMSADVDGVVTGTGNFPDISIALTDTLTSAKFTGSLGNAHNFLIKDETGTVVAGDTTRGGIFTFDWTPSAAGIYTYYCGPHSSTMNGKITVTTSAANYECEDFDLQFCPQHTDKWGNKCYVDGSLCIQDTRGAQGNKGAQGKGGMHGANGQPGERGAPGTDGAKGAKGAAGFNGPTGPVAPEYGSKGQKGGKGSDGMPGEQGGRAEKGSPGLPGTKGLMVRALRLRLLS